MPKVKVLKGMRVRYWPGVREGRGYVSVAERDELVLHGHTPGVYLRRYDPGAVPQGHMDFIALTHIEVEGPDELDDLLLEVEYAKYGDSNDNEIDALNMALDEALSMLGRSRPTLSDLLEIDRIENGEPDVAGR